jgi:hypothetical protein
VFSFMLRKHATMKVRSGAVSVIIPDVLFCSPRRGPASSQLAQSS